MTDNVVTEFDIEALKLLSEANIGLHLWRWESPLMGGGDEATPTYPRIDWDSQVSADEWETLTHYLRFQSIASPSE